MAAAAAAAASASASASSSPSISLSLQQPKSEAKSESSAGEPELSRSPTTSAPACDDGHAEYHVHVGWAARGTALGLFTHYEELVNSSSALLSVPEGLCQISDSPNIKEEMIAELPQQPAGVLISAYEPNCSMMMPMPARKEESMALSDLTSNTIDNVQIKKKKKKNSNNNNKSSSSSHSSSADIALNLKKKREVAETTSHAAATADSKRPRLSSIVHVEPSQPIMVNNAESNFAMSSPPSQALNTNFKPRAKRGSANDSQSIAARCRRERINARIKILQGLIPNGSKVDLVTMLENAINYVKGLQYQLEILKNDIYWPNQEKLSEILKYEMLRNKPRLLANAYVMEDASKLSPFQKMGIFVEPEEGASFMYISQIPQQHQSQHG